MSELIREAREMGMGLAVSHPYLAAVCRGAGQGLEARLAHAIEEAP